MLTRENLEKKRLELENAKKQLEMTIYQVIGKINGLNDLIEELDKVTPEKEN
jgi:hypothetical protein